MVLKSTKLLWGKPEREKFWSVILCYQCHIIHILAIQYHFMSKQSTSEVPRTTIFVKKTILKRYKSCLFTFHSHIIEMEQVTTTCQITADHHRVQEPIQELLVQTGIPTTIARALPGGAC